MGGILGGLLGRQLLHGLVKNWAFTSAMRRVVSGRDEAGNVAPSCP